MNSCGNISGAYVWQEKPYRDFFMSPQNPENSKADTRCRALTAMGARCKNKALPDQIYCKRHFPENPGLFSKTQGHGDMDRIAFLMEQILAELVAARQRADESAKTTTDSQHTELFAQILSELIQLRLREQKAREREQGIDYAALAAKALEFLEPKLALIKRRIDGDYEVDKWGRDLELVAELKPLFKFMYEKYWRVTTTGLENIPSKGSALLVGNHSGVVPWDGAMVIAAIAEEHPQSRMVRALHLSRATEVPIVGLALARMGQVQALPENAARLLDENELVLVFPEGVKGIGKPFGERYRLARFGRGGFVRVALRAGVPIIPVTIIGAEEIHPNMYNLKPLASLLNLPYIPATPTFPWLGPLGAIPLPTKWSIHFHKPIEVKNIKHRPAEEPLLVSKLSSQVRDTIQKKIYEQLKKRKNVFW